MQITNKRKQFWILEKKSLKNVKKNVNICNFRHYTKFLAKKSKISRCIFGHSANQGHRNTNMTLYDLSNLMTLSDLYNHFSYCKPAL